MHAIASTRSALASASTRSTGLVWGGRETSGVRYDPTRPLDAWIGLVVVRRDGTGRVGSRARHARRRRRSRPTHHATPCDADTRRVHSPAVDGRGVLGRRGEAVAEEFLRTNRYTIVARNYRCRAG